VMVDEVMVDCEMIDENINFLLVYYSSYFG